jgi:thiol reductant ABC exporter CydC subunit
VNPLLRVVRLAPPAPGRLAVAVAAGIGAAACAVGLMATSAWLVSRAAQRPPVLALSLAIVAVRGFGLFRGVLRYTERVAAHDLALRALTRLRVAVFRGLARIAPVGVAGYARGDLLTRLGGDVDAVQDLYVRVVVPVAAAAVTAVAAVGLAAALLPAAGAALGAGLVVAALLAPWVSARTAHRAERRLADERAAVAAATVELLDAAPDLVAFGAAERQLVALAARDATLSRHAGRAARWSGAGAALVTAAAGIAVLGGLVAGIAAVRTGRLPGVQLAVVTLLPLAVMDVVSAVPAALQHLGGIRRSAERLCAVLDTPDPSGGAAPASDAAVPASDAAVPGSDAAVPASDAAIPAAGAALELHDVSASWPGCPQWTISGVSLRIAPGRRVAVVGPSGAGKSTIAAVTAGLLKAGEGRVSLGGVDLAAVGETALRQHLTWVGQDAHIFHTSLRHNLLLARPKATDAELWDVLDAVRLRDVAERFGDGLDSDLGESGRRLSGGERQRLALARALLGGAPLLILDEPTAHLDPPTAEALTDDLLDATRSLGLLLVTHRAYGLDRVDEVVTVAQGRVVRRTAPHHDTPTGVL